MTQSYAVNKNIDSKGGGSADSTAEAGVRLLRSSSNPNVVEVENMTASETAMEEKQIAFIKTGKNGSGKEKMDKIEIEKEECHKKCVHWAKIVWSFISFWISVADVTVIIYLSYLHFHHSSDIMAWLMLLPILLNFIGIFTFLSDDDERREMESLGCQNVIWKNLMFFPVLGPSVSALKLFILSLREHEADKFERLESLLTRMKQYESFFRAAPEAFIQLTFRIISWSRAKVFEEEDYWTNLCLILCIFTLAESNMYSVVIPYYRMFQRTKTPDAWKVEHLTIPWRAVLFFFNFFSIESRLYADAIFKATACFYFHDHSFGEVIIVAFLCQFVVRAGLYGFFVGILGSRRQRMVLLETGVYGAFTYAWRSLFMAFDYQSYHPSIFLSFYLENLVLIGGSYAVILTSTSVDLNDKYIFHVYAGFAVLAMLLSITIRFVARSKYRKKYGSSNKVHQIKE